MNNATASMYQPGERVVMVENGRDVEYEVVRVNTSRKNPDAVYVHFERVKAEPEFTPGYYRSTEFPHSVVRWLDTKYEANAWYGIKGAYESVSVYSNEPPF